MKHMKKTVLAIAVSAMISTSLAGPYSPAGGYPNSTAISTPDDPNGTSVFVGWATDVVVERGFVKISDPAQGYVSHGVPEEALGFPQTTPTQTIEGVVSLGDAGTAVLTFERPIVNGLGYDFAVFENGFAPNLSEPNMIFLELAFVEVSSDGIHYERFPAVSLTQSEMQVSAFGYTSTLDTTNIHNLAGKYQAGYGTPFDLDEIKDVNDFVNVNAITHVRLVDVVGTLQSGYERYDSLGNIINDPWATSFSTGGFDLDAVGVIHQKTLMADVDRDGIVNLSDYAALSTAYLSDPNDPNWNDQCDLQPYADEVINIDDMRVMSDQWLFTEPWYDE